MSGIRTNKSSPVAWIAGVGASAGLGAALARRFARGGLTVVLTGRTPERVAALAEELRRTGAQAHALPGDVGSEAELAPIAARIAEIGPVEVAVFNAGNAVRAPSLEISAQQFEEAWRSSTLGGFLFAREAVRALQRNGYDADRTQGRGSLLITGATGSLRGKPPFAAFAAAKAALRSVAQSFAREFGPQGIHVAHVIVDGGINGERLRTNAPLRAAAAGPDGLLDPEAIAETYWQLHLQHRSAWTHEIDLRPYKEPF
jgi:NAD(P)-dependent dehydrogenase (short-subunit alcohol dehydrogenase family)